MHVCSVHVEFDCGVHFGLCCKQRSLVAAVALCTFRRGSAYLITLCMCKYIILATFTGYCDMVHCICLHVSYLPIHKATTSRYEYKRPLLLEYFYTIDVLIHINLQRLLFTLIEITCNFAHEKAS